MKRTRRLYFAAAAIIAGTQCSDSTGPDVEADKPLLQTAWRLVALDSAAPPISAALPERIPTVSFSYMLEPLRYLVGGTSPCNFYGGRYDAEHDGSIAIDSVVATRAGCGSDERLALEYAFYARLSSTSTWSVRGDTLTLSTVDARKLVFVRE